MGFWKFMLTCIRMLLPPYGTFAPEQATLYRYGSIGLWIFCGVFVASILTMGIALRNCKLAFAAEHPRICSILTAIFVTFVYFIIAYFGFYR